MAESTDRTESARPLDDRLAKMNADFQGLRADPSAWEAFKAETAAWDELAADVDSEAPDAAAPR